MEKWNPTQEAINKALRPNTFRKWLNTLLIIISGIGIVFLLIYFDSNKSVDVSSKNPTTDTYTQENYLEQRPQKNKPQNVSPTERNVKNKSLEDYSAYINTASTYSSGKTNIAITVVDENGNISTSISSSIANIYNQTGNSGNTGLIRSSFIHKSGFQELFEGNSEIIEKLKLSNHTDYIALGKIRYSMHKGTLVDGTIICTASLTMSIVSVNQKSITKSFTFAENGNGVTETQAKEAATEKLINKYYNEYSSL
jgi:hypothetical protein